MSMPRTVIPFVLLLGLAVVGVAAWFVLVSAPTPVAPPDDGRGGTTPTVVPRGGDASGGESGATPDPDAAAEEPEDDMRDLDRDPEGPEGGATSEEILAAFDAALAGNPLKWREVERLLAMGGSDDPAVTDRILELLGNERFRRWAVDYAAHLTDPAALGRLLEMAREAEDPWTRALALEAAARQVMRGDQFSGRGALDVRQAAETLIQQADPGSPLSNGAAAALAALDDPESTRVLVEMLRTSRDDPSGTLPLAEALGRVRDTESLAMLTRLALDEATDGPMRLAVITALGRTGDPEVAASLQDLARTTRDPAVKQQAFEALASIGDAASVESLVNAAAGEQDMERVAANNALGAVKNPAARVLLEQALDKSLDPGATTNVLRSLGRIGDPGSVPAIEATVLDDRQKEGVRKEGLRALGAIGDPRGADVSLRVLQESGSSAALRREAAGTLAKTATQDHYAALKKTWEGTRPNTAEYYLLGKRVRDLEKEMGIEDESR